MVSPNTTTRATRLLLEYTLLYSTSTSIADAIVSTTETVGEVTSPHWLKETCCAAHVLFSAIPQRKSATHVP